MKAKDHVPHVLCHLCNGSGHREVPLDDTMVGPTGNGPVGKKYNANTHCVEVVCANCKGSGHAPQTKSSLSFRDIDNQDQEQED